MSATCTGSNVLLFVWNGCGLYDYIKSHGTIGSDLFREMRWTCEFNQ